MADNKKDEARLKEVKKEKKKEEKPKERAVNPFAFRPEGVNVTIPKQLPPAAELLKKMFGF
jgi:hypothetical protein